MTSKVKFKWAFYAVGLSTIAAVVFYFFFLPLLNRKKELDSRISGLEMSISKEQDKHQHLQWERKMLEENDPEYLEKYARDNFGWAREGEIVYKLEDGAE
jgi:cell division protein FtsB